MQPTLQNVLFDCIAYYKCVFLIKAWVNIILIINKFSLSTNQLTDAEKIIKKKKKTDYFDGWKYTESDQRVNKGYKGMKQISLMLFSKYFSI